MVGFRARGAQPPRSDAFAPGARNPRGTVGARRGTLGVVLRRFLIVLLAVLAVPAGAARAEVVPYSVGARGDVGADLPHFRAVVQATLGDPRGWALGGAVELRRVARGGRLQVVLAPPAVVAALPGCSATYSCAAGTTAYVNLTRWRRGTASYPGATRRHPYRQHVINHEVGHVLGFGHATCAGAGRRAPLMQQQSKGLLGCRRNPWPLPSERAALARRLGVTAAPPPPRIVLGGPRAGAGGVRIGDDRARVRALLGAPARPDDPARERFPHAGLTVELLGDVVTAVTTRARGDRSATGVGPGARRRPGDAVCADGRCTVTRGDVTTTLTVRAGRTTAVTVARTAPAAALAFLHGLLARATGPRPR